MFLDCRRQLKVVRASVKDVFLHLEREDRSGKTKVGHLFSLSSKVQLDLLQTFPAYYCQLFYPFLNSGEHNLVGMVNMI